MVIKEDMVIKVAMVTKAVTAVQNGYNNQGGYEVQVVMAIMDYSSYGNRPSYNNNNNGYDRP